MAYSSMVQSLSRGLDILGEISKSGAGLGLGDLSERIGLKKTTAHNLARTLCSRGYLEKDRFNRYQLGHAIDEIVRVRYGQGIFARAEKVMKGLWGDMKGNCTVTLSELTGDEIICRLRMSPEAPGMIRRPESHTFSAFGSASGLCFQAFNVPYRERMSGHGRFEESGKSICETREELDSMLAESVREGATFVCKDAFWRLAAPVGEKFVLGLSFERDSVTDIGVVVGRLKDAARELASGQRV